MAELNHFAIAAGMGATLGHGIHVNPGQLGSTELAATISRLVQRRKRYIEDLDSRDDLTRKYEKAVTRAFLQVRKGFSSDRVLADPTLGKEFIRACRDFGLEDSVFHLNLALIGLRKHNKLKAKSKRSVVHDQWQYAVASEIAARTMFYRYGVSVDTTLAHPNLAVEFDKLAASITPGHSPFEYRWAALNMRKKGANTKLAPKVIDELEWSSHRTFNDATLPSEEGVYTLFEQQTCLFVAGTEDIAQSIASQRRIAEVPLFQQDLWQPKPDRLSWQFVRMPGSDSDYRFGVVRALVGQWEPVFNIPRGKENRKAA